MAIIRGPAVTAGLGPSADRRQVALMYHPRVPESRALAESLAQDLEARGAETRLLNAWEERGQLAARLEGVDWAIVLGGDGTVLRVVGLLASRQVPTVGINYGRLGFLAQVAPADAPRVVPELLAGGGRVEERLMLRVVCGAIAGADGDTGPDHTAPFDAVNDVFIGRGRVAHAVRIEVAVDGTSFLRFAADGLIVATPTGSTAYSLSAGGPVLAPALRAIVLTPVVPHPMPIGTLVLPAEARVAVTVHTEEEAICSIDGQRHYGLPNGTTVQVAAAPHSARFLRLGGGERFYQTLVERLRRW